MGIEGQRLLRAELTHDIIGAFYEVYNRLGIGFLESVYAAALTQELRAGGHEVACEVKVRIFYRGAVVANQRIDMVVDDAVIVEVKAGDNLSAAARSQLLNYLKATTFEVGLLLYFGPKPRFERLVSSNR